MSLHDSDENQEGTKLIVQRKGQVLVVPKSKEQKEKERDEQEEKEAALGSMVKVIFQCQAWDDIPAPSALGAKELTPYPETSDAVNTVNKPETVVLSPSKTKWDTDFGEDKVNCLTGQFFSHCIPVEATEDGHPAGYYWAHFSFSTSDLLNWKTSNPSSKG